MDLAFALDYGSHDFQEPPSKRPRLDGGHHQYSPEAGIFVSSSGPPNSSFNSTDSDRQHVAEGFWSDQIYDSQHSAATWPDVSPEHFSSQSNGDISSRLLDDCLLNGQNTDNIHTHHHDENQHEYYQQITTSTIVASLSEEVVIEPEPPALDVVCFGMVCSNFGSML